MHDFFRTLGLRLPLIQAPMAGVQDARLALAVARAGALGSLPCAMLGPEALAHNLHTLRQALGPQGVFNLNFFCHPEPAITAEAQTRWHAALAPLYQELGVAQTPPPLQSGRQPFSAALADAIEPFRPPVLSFHFGLPAPELLARVKSWGARVLASATTVAEAQWLQAHGADAIIAQGLEAGGHRGHFLSLDVSAQMGTFALVPQIVDAVRLPVIAAGGIASPREVRAALALGAAGVQAGTAYLLADEAQTSALHRQALRSPAARHTVLTRAFTGGAARGIRNRAITALQAQEAAIPAFPLAASGIAPLRERAEAQGSGEFSPLWSGQNNRALREASAEAITQWLGEGVAD
ncbi:nitronate monooxygenase [Allofranklinella schreckenbergeri]|uniref:Nitronate monooxygenase n=1 Tax=Allofranklinella schreckenbergeri TaxID=1076744 RepID=A0A3M6QIM5_9BURK|nr:nitronate monooxygenase [Allofranklinella schreckenbergeri]RMX02940.1 nitronate monooxygenase [Allofranklinella schreckenbergeri]